MNWQHLKAFVWLRWRLAANQWRRLGRVNAVLMIVVTAVVVITAIPLLIGSFALGVYAIPKAAPVHLLFAWDALIVGFLFFWSIGLMTELQRTDSLALSKFLHLPVSANGAFLINYLSSLVRLSLILFVPPMLGFALALVYVKGASQLLTLPLLAAFLLTVTALTYQFQGWLAALMSNPRRRRTVVVTMTTLFILVFQLPNLLNLFAPWAPRRQAARHTAQREERKALDRRFKAKEFGTDEHLRLQKDLLERQKHATQEAFRESAESWARAARVANAALPIGWLPLGVMTAAEGRILPSVLGLAALTLIGVFSLRRAYATTVGEFQGRASSRRGRPAAARAPATTAPARGRLLLEARIPGVSEPVSAIALGGLCSLLRSPEAKMALLTPVIMCGVAGTMMMGGGQEMPRLLRPLIATGGIAFVLLGVLQLAGNQFGFDRDGFRVFVLCAAPRRDILLGKNLAHAPFALGMGAAVLAFVQWMFPMRVDHLLAMVPQLVSMFAMFCIFTNFLAIYAPIHIPSGSMKPTNVKVTTVLLQMAMVTFLFPLTQAPVLLPLGTEALLEFLGWTRRGIPLCLALSLIECAAALLLFHVSLNWQGRLLQAREQRILETVTNRAT